MRNIASDLVETDASASQGVPLPDVSKDDIEKSRSGALARWDPARFQHMGPDELVQVQAALCHGSTYGYWQTPRNWLTKQQRRSPSRLNIDLRRRLRNKVLVHLQLQDGEQPPPDLEQWLDQAVLTMTRLLLLLRCADALGRHLQRQTLAPSSILSWEDTCLVKCLSLAVAQGLRGSLDSFAAANGERRILGQITARQVKERYGDSNSKKKMSVLEDRLRHWSEVEYWRDVFAKQDTSAIHDLKSGKSPNSDPKHESVEYKPLPDEYAALLAKRSLWLMREIGPNLVRIAPQFAAMYAKSAELVRKGRLAPTSVTAKHRFDSVRILRNFIWLDSRGRALTGIPFPLALSSDWRAQGGLPRSRRALFDLMAYVQTAHQVIAGLTMGARESELLDMTRGCVEERMVHSEGCYYVHSKTFKTAGAHEGERREWPVVAQVKEAVASQELLMSALDKINAAKDPGYQPTSDLWGRFALMSDSQGEFTTTNLWLRHYTEALGMDKAPGGQNFTSHRLRKTLARVVALALVDSPMVLYEIFGHRDIAMTLHYILANKSLKQEVEAIAREINVMRATEVVEVMAQSELRRLAGQSLPGDLHGGCGGGAAGPIDAHVREELRKVHERGESWGADDAIELGRLLTNAGQQWMLVRKGVICTKSPGVAGPCSLKARGRPEPSKCSSECAHRLEREFLRNDVREILDTAVKAYEQALVDEENGLAAYWGGQIRINIGRFPDIELEYMQRPSVAAYLSEKCEQ
jgi:integrase